MPTYDYACERCGSFVALRPLAMFDASYGRPSLRLPWQFASEPRCQNRES